MSRYKGDNSGGYANPPISGQFKSGNKMGGRKPGSRSIESALKKVLSGDVTYKENGLPKTASATDALAIKALQHGLGGTYRANEKVRELAVKYGPQDEMPADQTVDLTRLSDDDLKLYAYLAAKAEGWPIPPGWAPHVTYQASRAWESDVSL